MEGKLAPDAATAEFTVTERSGRSVIQAPGDLGARRAANLALVISRLSPQEHPSLTLDLSHARAVSPVVVHALLRAWEDRGRMFGSVRVLMGPGPVARYLLGLGLDHALDCVEPEVKRDALPIAAPEVWRQAQEEALAHYRALFEAAAREDLEALQGAARQAHPLCVASGAKAGGTAFGSWCHHCPLQHQFGGCQPLIERMLSDAQRGNWEAAQLLAMTLTAELVGMDVGGD